MHIKRITATSVMVPYEPPLGPYIGRGGPPGSLGGHGLIVKIESDTGLVGWGEGTGQLETDPTDLLAGQHIADVEASTALMIEAGIGKGPMSGIEMALWDLLGKACRQPVYELLGGRRKNDIRAYATTYGRDRFAHCRDLGYTAVKFGAPRPEPQLGTALLTAATMAPLRFSAMFTCALLPLLAAVSAQEDPCGQP